jgi:hypothetical protein
LGTVKTFCRVAPTTRMAIIPGSSSSLGLWAANHSNAGHYVLHDLRPAAIFPARLGGSSA